MNYDINSICKFTHTHTYIHITKDKTYVQLLRHYTLGSPIKFNHVTGLANEVQTVLPSSNNN